MAKDLFENSADAAAQADPADAYNRAAQTFPEFTDEQMKRVGAYGQIESVAAGDWLYRRGDVNLDFFVVVEGRLEALETLADGSTHQISTMERHHFSGELNMFNNRGSLVGVRALEDSRVLRVPRDRFRRLLTGENELSELVTRAFILRRSAFLSHEFAAIVLVGPAHSAELLQIRQFLQRNGIPVRTLYSDVADNAEVVRQVLTSCSLEASSLPAVIYDKDRVLCRPSNAELGKVLGFTEVIEPETVHDVVIVGAGPAGLSSAVYGASEGLSTVVVDSFAPGGQAGSSSKIENYMGFPAGISGHALAARAQVQAQKFGAKILVPRKATHVRTEPEGIVLTLDDGSVIRSRALIIATGAHYRQLNVDGMERFEGVGLHYAATAVEATLCSNEDVAVVGAGNSAGQAAMYLSERTTHVHLLVRGQSLEATMSAYLVRRLEVNDKITIHLQTEITKLEGESYLETVTWRNGEGQESRHKIGNVFLMIGAVPNTEWLRGCIALDNKGFVLCDQSGSPYNTSAPGIFAVGDVRAGSIKRVASAVGEGSVVISAVHAHLAKLAAPRV